MHQRYKAITIAGLLTVSASSVLAADYTVQIGAFGVAPEKGFTRDASEFGEVLVNEAADGVTRVSVGRYTTPSDAKAALTRLQIAGYNDAYVTRVKSGLTAQASSQTVIPAQATPATSATSTGQAPQVSAAPSTAQTAAATTSSSSSKAGRFRLRTHDTQSGETTDLQVAAGGNQPPAVVAGVGADKVPPHLRNKLVYLDGVPHIKDGDQFIPMKEAVAGKP